MILKSYGCAILQFIITQVSNKSAEVVDVVLPNDEGAFKMPTDSFSLLFCYCSRNVSGISQAVG
jgi:hypothetical protein